MAGEQLRITDGEAGGQTIPVDSEILFGRGSTDELGRLGDDPLLSRRHARIGRGPGGQLIVEDLGSANGTFANDERIDGVHTLALGDRVRVGGTVFQVTDAQGAVPGRTQVSESPPPREPAAEPAPAPQPSAPPPSAPEELLVTGGLAQGKRLGLEEELELGRAPADNGGLGEDPGLSRRHARISRDTAGGLVIEDLGSANGTFVNGQPISEPRALAVGDSVRVGQTTLEVVEQGQDASPAAASGPPTVASPAAQPQPPPRQAPQPQPPQSPAPPPEAHAPPLPQEQTPRARRPDPPRAAPQPQSPPAPPAQKDEQEGQKRSNVLAAIGLIGVVILLVLIIIALG